MDNKEKGRIVKHYSKMDKGELMKNKNQVSKMGKGYNPIHQEAIKRTLDKAKGESMVGKLKRLIKEPRVDHYANFKKQHNVK